MPMKKGKNKGKNIWHSFLNSSQAALPTLDGLCILTAVPDNHLQHEQIMLYLHKNH